MALIQDSISSMGSCHGRKPRGFWVSIVDEFQASDMDCAIVTDDDFPPMKVKEGLVMAIRQHRCYTVQEEIGVSMKKGVVRLYRKDALDQVRCNGWK